jgi:hypothetical protein
MQEGRKVIKTSSYNFYQGLNTAFSRFTRWVVLVTCNYLKVVVTSYNLVLVTSYNLVTTSYKLQLSLNRCKYSYYCMPLLMREMLFNVHNGKVSMAFSWFWGTLWRMIMASKVATRIVIVTIECKKAVLAAITGLPLVVNGLKISLNNADLYKVAGFGARYGSTNIIKTFNSGHSTRLEGILA